jgi:GNAT superfamily N-acetyltransferase
MVAPVRRPADDELPLLPAIELAAGRRFVEAGLGKIAEGEPTDAEVLRAAHARGMLWVGVDDADRPVGFAAVDVLDGCAYLSQISVHIDHGGRGIGTALLDAVTAWARGAGFPAVTLSTFRALAWNGPWYRRYGFRELGADEITPGLAAVRHKEAADGLEVDHRICMCLDL